MIAIIGGGPSGSYLASLLARERDVTIFEEHPEIGNPIQCTGILSSSSSALQVKIPEEIIVNKIKKIELISPDNNSITFNLKEPDLITNRMELDRFLANEAVNNGAKIELNHRFVNYENGKISVRHKGELKNYNVGALIGADGPNSQVAKSVNLYGERKFWVARQCRVKIKNDPELFKVYFGSQISNDFFGWVVPESETKARVGIASEKNVGMYFEMLRKKLNLKEKDLNECQAGPIPIYNPKNVTSKDKVYLIGDAAGQIKSTTGGGIVYGMRAGKILADCLNNDLDYEKEWRKKLHKDLMFHLRIRRFLNKLDKNDYNELIRTLKDIDLGEFNRDYPLKNLGMFMKPSLVGFFLRNSYKAI